MSIAIFFKIIFLLATLFTSLVAGFLLAFAIVVMPGIKSLDDHEFIRAFQGMDGIIQKNHPIFLIIWVGSFITLLFSAILGMWQLEGMSRNILLLMAITYTVGVQLPTIAINIPLNNRVQTLDTFSTYNHLIQRGRKDFESLWNTWNVIRTLVAILVSVFLMIIPLSVF